MAELKHNNQEYSQEILAPKAKKIPTEILFHDDKRIDEYDWLRSRTWPDVKESDILNYLKLENAYAEAFFKPLEETKENLFKEFVGRIKLADSSVPVKEDDYYYSSYTTETSEYPIHIRKKDSLDNPEEVIFDENKESAGHKFFKLEDLGVSPDHKLIAYSVDTNGSERYTIKIRNLENKTEYAEKIYNTIGGVVWHENGSGFFYTPVDENWRCTKVLFHKLGTDPKDDVLIYEEKDITFRVDVSKSASKQYVFVDAASSTSNEYWYIDLNDPRMELKIITARKDDHLYFPSHHGKHFYIQTNDKGKNFRLVKAITSDPKYENWQEVIPHNPKIYLNYFNLFENHLVVGTKEEGLPKIKIINLNDNSEKLIEFTEAAYNASVDYTTFDAEALRYDYSSLNTPSSVLEYNFETYETKVLKVKEIPSGFDKELYQVERLWAETRDGVKVPISLIYKKDLKSSDGNNPLYLYGYGSYGLSVLPYFRSTIFSLVDRGFIYAIAHIRGGDDLGYEWYEDAKFLNKKRTFNDFIDVAEHLIKERYTIKGNIVTSGGSAGGMLVGVAVNERPELFKAVIADVPFVDVLNTMLDETLPLTPGEFKEWGNPKDKEYYDYIKSYSPYDNVKTQNYPHMFVTAGLNDPRVTYWEPAKWVAKLRDLKTDSNILLFDTNMDQGHGGASGRFDYLKEITKEYAFILKVFGLI
jgi:oligopeptidase B